MGENNGKRRKKDPVQAALIAVVAVLVLGLFTLLFFGARAFFSPSEPRPGVPGGSPTALAMPEDKLPTYLYLGEPAPMAAFQTALGASVSLSDLVSSHSVTWLVFWASWCPDCDEQFAIISEMESLAEAHGVNLMLVDRLDTARESVQAAEAKLRDLGVRVQCVFDPEAACYAAWGLHEIPSAVVLDAQGVVREYRSGIMTRGECQGMLERATTGRSAPVLAYLDAHLSNGQGGVFASSNKSASSPAGNDVLSESQGLMMAYALERNDPDRFRSAWAYARDNLRASNGLFAWYAGEKDTAGVNALLDDLRRWRALDGAAARWGDGEYAAEADELLRAILDTSCNGENGLVDFVDLNTGARADTISLCYLDLETLAAMTEKESGFAPVLARAEELLKNGRISEAFPLYYAKYDYRSGTYGLEDLNTAEALYTLLHLARAGKLDQNAFSWLRDRIKDGTLAARYHVDGTVVPGYEYHSTAVYGLAARVALEAGDGPLFELAVRRMERKYTLDAEAQLYGAYSQKGATVYAFDQLIPLLVNAALDERTGL